VARHLTTLQLLGQAEMRKAGISHIYCPASRVPEYAVRLLVKDPLLLVTPSLTIHGMNPAAGKFFNCHLPDVTGRKITAAPFSSLLPRELLKKVRSGIDSTRTRSNGAEIPGEREGLREQPYSLIPVVSDGWGTTLCDHPHLSPQGREPLSAREAGLPWELVPDQHEMVINQE